MQAALEIAERARDLVAEPSDARARRHVELRHGPHDRLRLLSLLFGYPLTDVLNLLCDAHEIDGQPGAEQRARLQVEVLVVLLRKVLGQKVRRLAVLT